MRKNKLFLTFIICIIVTCCVFIMAACEFDSDDTTHTHDWQNEWSSDNAFHWYKCNGCTEIKDKVAHSYTNGVCICGKTENSEGEETPIGSLLSYSLSEDGSYAICNGFSEGKDSSDIIIDSEFEGKPVKEIAARAFYAESNLKSVVIPDSVDKIGEYAFYNSSVKDINLPNNLKKIEKAIFTKSKLTKVVIPDSVTEVGEQAFWACKDLTSVKISNNVTNIGTYAFYECEKLSVADIPESVRTIGNYVFSRTAIERATISSNVTTIGKGVFYQSYNLKSVEINSKTVGETMFKECYALENVTIGSNTTEIGASAFYSCKALYEMTLSQNITKVGSYAFQNCYALTLYCESAQIISGLSTTTSHYSVVLDCKNNKQDSKMNEYFVVDNIKYAVNMKMSAGQLVEDFARIIRGQRGATELEIPDTVNYDGKDYNVKIINDYAFQSNSNIQKLQIGNNIETIGISAFDNCDGIENVVFGNKVITIDENAFSGCSGITNLELPDSVVNINQKAFYRAGVTRVFISKNVKSMFSKTFHPFYGCQSIDNIAVDSENQYYKSENNLLLNKSGTTLYIACKGSGAIPQTVITIGKYSYAGLETLKSLNLPEGVKIIDSGAFRDCVNLSQISFPSTVTSFKNEAFANTGFVDFVIPNTVTNLDQNLFAECSKLKNITLPANFVVPFNFHTIFTLCPVLESISLGGEHKNYITKQNSLLSKDGTELVFGVLNSTIPSSVTSIAKDAYCGRDIESIVIPSSVTNIGSAAFWQCKKLKSVIIPSGVTVIESQTFASCEKLTTITIPNSVTEIGSNALSYSSSLESIIFQGTKAEWNAIKKSSGWDSKTGNYTIKCTDGTIAKA